MTEQYLADFKTFAGNGAAAAPAWLKEMREGAIARFAELGFPTMKQEAWRFTNVAPIAETRFHLGAPARVPLATPAALERVSLGVGPRIVFVDGQYAPALSTRALPAGVWAGSLARALEGGPEAALARAHLARHARWAESAFAALNTAFLRDGALMRVAAGVTLEQPIEVVFLASGRPGPDGPLVSHPRSLVVIERGATATVIETYAALDDGLYWTNAVTELVVGEGAQVEHYRVQREGACGYQIATTQSHQHRDSSLALHVLTLGAALARHDIGTVLGGRGAELILNGLYLLGDTQHADHHTLIDHAEPHCASHEYFNGVLAGRAHGVFNGRIIVRPGAQRTDSKQTNNNLLLSTDARADSQPQLEIYADDVKCTHGSTVGPVDVTQLYYLQSRGLDPAAARALLTYGFGIEILDRMRQPAVRARLDELVRERLA